MKATLPIRLSDKFGSGAYRAKRGDRWHRGVDLSAYAGTLIFPIRPGNVTKLGYPYKDDLSFRYVQVTDLVSRLDFRYFYLEPLVSEGDLVGLDIPIGKVQDLTKKYPGITNHVHFEVKDGSRYSDPNDFL